VFNLSLDTLCHLGDDNKIYTKCIAKLSEHVLAWTHTAHCHKLLKLRLISFLTYLVVHG